MRSRPALVIATLLATGGCASAVHSSTDPAAAPSPTVAPLAFTFATDGPILDLFCPDAVPRPLHGLTPETESDTDTGTS